MQSVPRVPSRLLQGECCGNRAGLQRRASVDLMLLRFGEYQLDLAQSLIASIIDVGSIWNDDIDHGRTRQFR